MARKLPSLAGLDRAREKIERLRAELDEAIRDRNTLIATAKLHGHPAAEVYRRAGITAGTYSRQHGKVSG
jgi:hypothetical protein